MGDVFDKDSWAHVLPEAIGVVSSIGPPHPFGGDEFMERISGDANVAAIEASSDAGVPNLAFISAAPADKAAQVPSFILKGYLDGKRKAEAAVDQLYPNKGVNLRPGMVYGTRG